MPGKQFKWLSLRSSKTLEAMRSHHKLLHKRSLRIQTLQKMTAREGTLSTSPSEQELVDIIQRAQCRRYDSQRSPFPSPGVARTTPSNNELVRTNSPEEENDVDTPTNNRRAILNDSEQLDDSTSSDEGCSPNHIVPPESPVMRMKPNRRSVEALKKLISSSDIKGPYPLIIDPPDGGYWIKNGEYETSKGEDGTYHAPEIDTEHFRLENDSTSLMYGCHFVGRLHKNFYVKESKFGPLVFSLMIDSDVNCDPLIRMILRTKSETYYKVYPSAQLSRKLEPEEYLGIALASLNDGEPVRIDGLTRIHSKKAPEILQKFDEHSVAKQHKVGVIYQRFGQTTEEEMFGNNDHSPAFKEFLKLLGDTVTLKDFQEYCGGLDNKNGQTGDRSVYTKYKGQEIMFHVSTLLPYDPMDRQQVARKRHIGNDIVLVVFQDCNTPYSPDCVRSRFLHAHIVVQVEQNNSQGPVYKVAVAAKENVPDFSPPLPTPAVFSNDPDFREWLLTKILNAEASCYKAPAFLRLATRTRSQLFIHLLRELSGAKESDINNVTVDNAHFRKSVGPEILDSEFVQSPRRRRMTFGSLFPPRRKISGTGSPPKQTAAEKRSILTTSTPDLSTIGEESTNNRTSHRISIGGHKDISTNKKRFTLRGGRGKKYKSLVSTTTEIMAGDHHTNKLHDTRYKQQNSEPQGVYRTEDTPLGSNLNWSVPSDLPGVVTQIPSHHSPNPGSLENITFSLEDDSYRHRSSSNPDIARAGEQRYLSSATPIDRSPGSAGPHTFDVAVQVDYRRQMFTFPTPPQSVSPTLPQETHNGQSIRRYRMRPVLEQQQNDVLSGYHSSSSSLDTNRQSFPFVPEEDESKIDVIKENNDSDSSLEDIADSTYDSLLSSLQALTSEVARLRQQQLQLYKENSKLSNQVKKWKTKYKHVKLQQNNSSGDVPHLPPPIDRKSKPET